MKLALFTTALYLVACLIHELGHAAPAMWYGLPWKIRIGWLGPYCQVRGRYIAHENAAVAAGGPVASIVGALLVWWAGFHAIAFIIGLIGAANALDIWHAVQALKLRKEVNNADATS